MHRYGPLVFWGPCVVATGALALRGLPCIPSTLGVPLYILLHVYVASTFAVSGPGPRGIARRPPETRETLDGWTTRLSPFRLTFMGWSIAALFVMMVGPVAHNQAEWNRIAATNPRCGNSFDRVWMMEDLIAVWAAGLILCWLGVHVVSAVGTQVSLRGRVLRAGSRTVILDGEHTVVMSPSHEQLVVRTRSGRLRLRGGRDGLRWVYERLQAVPQVGSEEDVPAGFGLGLGEFAERARVPGFFAGRYRVR